MKAGWPADRIDLAEKRHLYWSGRKSFVDLNDPERLPLPRFVKDAAAMKAFFRRWAVECLHAVAGDGAGER